MQAHEGEQFVFVDIVWRVVFADTGGSGPGDGVFEVVYGDPDEGAACLYPGESQGNVMWRDKLLSRVEYVEGALRVAASEIGHGEEIVGFGQHEHIAPLPPEFQGHAQVFDGLVQEIPFVGDGAHADVGHAGGGKVQALFSLCKHHGFPVLRRNNIRNADIDFKRVAVGLEGAMQVALCALYEGLTADADEKGVGILRRFAQRPTFLEDAPGGFQVAIEQVGLGEAGADEAAHKNVIGREQGEGFLGVFNGGRYVALR